jgi:HlyD family secretion protein
MAKWFAYLTMAVIILIYIDRKVNVRCCRCFAGRGYATISTVSRGIFSQTIPQNGKVTDGKLVVEIDQLYLPRIKTGLSATSSTNNVQLNFHISHVNDTIVNGKFSVVMDSADTTMMQSGQSVRLRIQLSEPHEATLIPVGGFYKDTGGTWIYVMADENHFAKRKIKLGAKNPDYFTVLEGLEPGEKVMTSSYENFPDKEKLLWWEIQRRGKLGLM